MAGGCCTGDSTPVDLSGLFEGSGVIVEAVACDGACTASTNGIGNGNGSEDGYCNGNGSDGVTGTGNGKGIIWMIDLATYSAAADMLWTKTD